MFAFITATAGLRTRWLACVAAPALRGACAGVLVGVFAGASAMAQVVQPDDYQAIALNWARGAAAGDSQLVGPRSSTPQAHALPGHKAAS